MASTTLVPLRFAQASERTLFDDTRALAQGPFASMRAQLRKSIFRVEVLDIELRFDEPTRQRLLAVSRGKDLKQSADALTRAACEAEAARVRVLFSRSVPVDKLVKAALDGLQCARRAGLISQVCHDQLAAQLPARFNFLARRGFRRGDELTQWADAGSLRTMLRSADGQILLDQVDQNPEAGQALLSSYVAPRSALREPLLKSLGR